MCIYIYTYIKTYVCVHIYMHLYIHLYIDRGNYVKVKYLFTRDLSDII